jgi:uracil-DNA glycosylase
VETVNPQRLQYLQALDIDVWQRRAAVALPAAEMPVAERVAVPVSTVAAPPSEPADLGPPAPTAAPASVSGLGWAELEERVRQCSACQLHRTRTRAVFGVGNVNAQWMIIGEAPGADEDRQGEPFVGRAGQLLNSMLKAIGLAREQVYIANILKSRPPNNRDPAPAEVSACIPYLFRQIELINPRVLLCVGRIAAQSLLNTDTSIGKLRGKLHTLETGRVNRPLIVTYHPAYLLRSPLEKRRVWSDLVLAMQTFEQLSQGEAAATTQ